MNDVLAVLEGEFAKLYAASGRPSIPPERLLRALLLQAFYTIRSETQLMEQLDYNLLYRWFVGLGVDEPVWVQTVFTKNRDRLLEAEVAHKFLAELLNHKEVRSLLSNEHFSVDGTQIAAWASMIAAEEFAKGLEVLIEDIARDEGLDLQTARKFVTRELERWVKFNYGLYDTMLVC